MATYGTEVLQRTFIISKFLLVCSLCLLSAACAGAQADNTRKECVNEQIALACPQLQSVIRRKDYKELYWTVRVTGDESKEPQNIGYCDENLTCTTYRNIGGFDQRIKIRNPVGGSLFVRQLIWNDQLTYKCEIARKQNRPPIASEVEVSSSKNCLSATAGQTLTLSEPLQGRISKENVEDVEWYGILQDGTKVKLAYCSPRRRSCVMKQCTSACPEFLTRLKTDGLSIILTNVSQDDRGLEFQCNTEPVDNQRTAATMKPAVYTIRINDISPPQVNVNFVKDTTDSSTTKTAAPTGKNKGSYSVQSLWLLALSVLISLLIATDGIS